MKKNYFYIAGLIGLAAVVVVLIWQNLELKKSQNVLLDRMQQAGSSREGRVTDPYIAGPVKNTITKNARGIQECYNAFIDRKPVKTDGLIVADWRIDTRGNVIKPEIVSSELADPALGACMTGKIAMWNFPPPQTEKYISHRFTFKKQ